MLWERRLSSSNCCCLRPTKQSAYYTRGGLRAVALLVALSAPTVMAADRPTSNDSGPAVARSLPDGANPKVDIGNVAEADRNFGYKMIGADIANARGLQARISLLVSLTLGSP